MKGVWNPSLRAVMLFAIVVFALLGFAAAKITTVDGIASGEDPHWTVAANASPDTPGFAAPILDQHALKMWQNLTLNDRELGTWLLIIFGLGAVVLALRRQHSDRARHQFV
jgi:hypothetical protein